jgi:asparagine synthase (glutamine-hydrolysing)
MCGIVGWLSSSAAHPVAGEILARMRDTMVHRGPDGDGLWIAPGREVGLGFRRLAIIDLSTNANQPMANEGAIVSASSRSNSLREKGNAAKDPCRTRR